MDPFNMPTWGGGQAPDPSTRLTQVVGQALPLATTYHGAQSSLRTSPMVYNKVSTPQPSNISKFFHFIGGVGSEIGHIAGGAASWLAKNSFEMAAAPLKLGTALGHNLVDQYELHSINAQQQQLSDQFSSLNRDFKAGRISSKTYQAELKVLSNSFAELGGQSQALSNRAGQDIKAAIKPAIDTATDIVTILTAGFGKAASVAVTRDGLQPLAQKTAADYLASTSATAYLGNVERGLTKLASDPQLFAKLSPSAQMALQKATAEVVVGNAGTMTAGQIGRAAAVNLALKYPIYYNMLSTTSQDIYQKLDDKQYGDAVREIAVNAAFLLAGGPIGQALKYGGKATSGIKSAMFGRSAFIDELSKGIGDGNPAGLYNAINAIKDPAIRQEIVQNLSAVEATNMAAVTGKDAVAAAWRVLNGMSAYEGISMAQFTHEEALNNMVNFAKAQRLVDEVGKAHNLGPITVGRVDARALNTISAELSPIIEGGNKDAAFNAWEALKAENPTQAWANNDNFDRQIKNLINRHSNPTELDEAIRNIRASFYVEGFPKAQAKQLSKMGYIPIKPVALEAPFREGTGKLSSSFASGNDDFFLKSVQPLPVLESVGAALTMAGLSPSASTSRVYELFNQNLAHNLTDLKFINTVADKGATSADTADTLIKKLSNYAHNPTRGIHINGRPLTPITDLRQLTTRDISEALNVSMRDARDVKSAIMDAMIRVPLQVRGLGDRLVDVGYKTLPMGRYLRLQGALRFSWNPFFQAKLATKTELLSQLEAGGKFPTLGGTNTILSMVFPDKYDQIDGIRKVLREKGIFDEKAIYGEAIGGEAVNDVGVAGANLTHKLIPSQERSIASMVAVQADKVGMDVKQFVEYFPNEVRDTVQMIAQYDRNSEFLNSAMARTLNLAFFPFRFEYKVASITARSLARTSFMTQLAVINGLYRASTWLNTPEGQAWYSKNSEVIGLIKYFTPIQTLSEVGSLLGGHPDSIGAYGELGGLPFGWIPQLLDAEGLTHFGGGYVSPKTGQTIPQYIPDTDKAKLASALQDFIGSLFSYPGATVGLPSKTSITQNIALGVTGASKKDDFTKIQPPIPEQDQSFANTVQQMAHQNFQSNQQNFQMQQPTPQIQPGIKVPARSSPLTTPVYKPKKSGTGTSGRRKKKSEYTPYLLPGQTELGQLP